MGLIDCHAHFWWGGVAEIWSGWRRRVHRGALLLAALGAVPMATPAWGGAFSPDWWRGAAAPASPVARAASRDYSGPLVDAHAHLEGDSGVSAEGLLGLYDETGVRAAWLFGSPWSVAAEAARRYPARFVPFLAEGYTATLAEGSAYRDAGRLEALLGDGTVRGLGEIILRHSAFRLGPAGGGYAAPAVDVPADHPVLLEAYAVADRYRVPVVVHQEAAYVAELERALAAAPGTTFVWAHAGHGPAATLRSLLGRYPNLYADLAARTPWLGPGTVITDGDGTLRAEWAALLAEYPDRLLIGFDLFVPAHYRLPYVRDTVGYYRGLLGQLDPAAAEQIAFRNADRLAPLSTAVSP
jgi:hypothetical protein